MGNPFSSNSYDAVRQALPQKGRFKSSDEIMNEKLKETNNKLLWESEKNL